MELFVSYAIISSLFWASFSFMAKYILSKKMKSYISFAYLQGITIIIIFPILSYLIVPDQVFFPPIEVVPYAMISGGTSILAYLLMYYGLTKYDASSASSIIATQSIFVIPLTYIFLKEFYGLIVILWILIAVLGAIMTSWDENINARQLFSFKNRSFLIFFSSAFLYALGNVAVKPAMKIVSNFNFLIWREFAWFLVLLALMPLIFHKREQKRLQEDWKGAIGFVIIGILIQYFGYILLFYALGRSVQITMGLIALNGFFAVIIGFFLSKTSLGILLEKHDIRIYLIRMVGALIILFSIYKLSFVL